MSIDNVCISMTNEDKFLLRVIRNGWGRVVHWQSWVMMSFSMSAIKTSDSDSIYNATYSALLDIAVQFCFFDIHTYELITKERNSLRGSAFSEVSMLPGTNDQRLKMLLVQSQNPLDTRVHVMVPLGI
ncbi:hypothetical protein Tco_1017279 [Tanacetum coccineum]|uniref:Uncharacterized protein n=1 Tax=Tanacetum coccineum TaxID=301880 RepID=A0ABQ5FRI5_9ASTR